VPSDVAQEPEQAGRQDLGLDVEAGGVQCDDLVVVRFGDVYPGVLLEAGASRGVHRAVDDPVLVGVVAARTVVHFERLPRGPSLVYAMRLVEPARIWRQVFLPWGLPLVRLWPMSPAVGPVPFLWALRMAMAIL